MTWEVGAGLAGKTVVVTGAAGAIGSAVVRVFAQAEARVCLVDVAHEPMLKLLGRLSDPTASVAIACDLGVAGQLQSMFDQVQTTMGGLDVLVHAAAVLERLMIDDVTEELWDWHLNINLKVTFFVDRHTGPDHARAGPRRKDHQLRVRRLVDGRSSTRRRSMRRRRAGWSRCPAASPAPSPNMGSPSTASRPGTVDSRMVRSGLSPEQIEHLADGIPLGRLAEPEDIACPRPSSWPPPMRATSRRRR